MPKFRIAMTLLTSVEVEACDSSEAKKIIRNSIDGGEANLGAWPNGDPIVADIKIEGDLDLDSVDDDGGLEH